MAETTAGLGYADSLGSSPRSHAGDWDDSLFPAAGRLRLMCSYGGRIVPRPSDKSLRYIGGETRIVVVDRNSSLADLLAKLSHSLIGGRAFSLKYQLPNEDLDSLISVSTDEDLDNMIEEYDRILASAAASPAGSRSSRLRLFLFPSKPEMSPTSSIGSLLDDSKSETWFLDALNGVMGIDRTPRGLSAESASVNCLLGLEDDPSIHPHRGAAIVAAGSGGGGHSERADQLVLPRTDASSKSARQAQEVQSVPDSPMLDTTSSFGSASSAPSLSSLPPIRVHPDDRPFDLRITGLDYQFAQMNLATVAAATTSGQRLDDDFKEPSYAPQVQSLSTVPLSASPASTLTISPTENPGRVFSSDDEKLEHGGTQKLPQQPTKPTQGEAPISDSSSRAINLNAGSDPKQDLVSSIPSYDVPIPATDAAKLQLSSLEQFQQQQQELHAQFIHQQQQLQQQYIQANPHYMHNPAIGGVIPVPTLFPIARHPIQQSLQTRAYNPQIPLYFYPVPPPSSYNLAAVQPGLRDSNLASQAANTAMPAPQFLQNSELPPSLYRATAVPSPASTHLAPDQAHSYAGMGYHVLQQQHLSQPPATMPNYSYEFSVDHSQPQMYYSQPTSSPALTPRHQPLNSGVASADAPADAKANKA